MTSNSKHTRQKTQENKTLVFQKKGYKMQAYKV